MASATLRRRWAYVGLSLIAALSLYYLYRAINYRFFHPGRFGPDLFNKRLWYFSHVAFALPVVFGGPLQFITSLRVRWPRFHRGLGKAYVIGASGAAVLAFYLGAIVGEYEGSILSIAITSLMWLFFTLTAWRHGSRPPAPRGSTNTSLGP